MFKINELVPSMIEDLDEKKELVNLIRHFNAKVSK